MFVCMDFNKCEDEVFPEGLFYLPTVRRGCDRPHFRPPRSLPFNVVLAGTPLAFPLDTQRSHCVFKRTIIPDYKQNDVRASAIDVSGSAVFGCAAWEQSRMIGFLHFVVLCNVFSICSIARQLLCRLMPCYAALLWRVFCFVCCCFSSFDASLVV